MDNYFSRTSLFFGVDGMQRLKNARVAVFGIGGVGSYVVEALARSGIGAIDLIDSDTVSETNINRQLVATSKTIGMLKTHVAMQRVTEINPDCKVTAHSVFYLPETADSFDFSEYDYVVDAVDTVTAKLELVKRAEETGTKIISSMGAGNKLDPTKFQVADIYKTSVCPLAKVMRAQLRKLGIKKLKVVFSTEEPAVLDKDVVLSENMPQGKRSIPASNAFTPSVAGLIIAGEVIKDIASGNRSDEA